MNNVIRHDSNMSANIFDKILKIVQVVVTILQFAVKSFFDVKDEVDEPEE